MFNLIRPWLQTYQYKNEIIYPRVCKIGYVCDKLMLLTLCWWQFWGVDDWITILVTSFDIRRLSSKIKDVGDENGQNCHQHLKLFSNSFCLQYPSPTSVFDCCVSFSWFVLVQYQSWILVAAPMLKLKLSIKRSLFIEWILNSRGPGDRLTDRISWWALVVECPQLLDKRSQKIWITLPPNINFQKRSPN